MTFRYSTVRKDYEYIVSNHGEFTEITETEWQACYDLLRNPSKQSALFWYSRMIENFFTSPDCGDSWRDDAHMVKLAKKYGHF